jgi:5'-deoxynucleotidase YfbR-like HD superfamily hydrolase
VSRVSDAEKSLLVDRVPQPEGVPERLVEQLRFIVEVDRLKTVLRRNPLVADERRENDAEHSWHLALMVLVLAEYADEPVDVAKTLALVLVHDLVEVYAGDTWIHDQAAVAGQAERERAAADRLFPLLPADQAHRFRALWDEFEARTTPEARFARAVDRFQPMLLNFNAEGGTWLFPGVTAEAVRARTRVMRDGASPLWDYAERLISLAAARGWMPES